MHFLLVEDEAAHAELIRLSLVDNKVANTLDHVQDGEAALEYLQQEGRFSEARRPDVILLDLKLPKIDGHEVLEWIKGRDHLATIPVVVLTTSSNEIDRAKAYARHANSYLAKPVDFPQFQRMIRDLGLYWTVWNQPPARART
ncbi:MAG: response regulator [Phycisphaerales bacterium]